MVERAQRLIRVSTDGLIGRKQIDYAAAEYDPLRIRVNGEWHDFKVAKVIQAGKEYIETERVTGAHLNALPPGTVKAARSVAIETAEIYRLLKGKATDKDRHGGQQGIENATIGMFDLGQLPYSLETGEIAEPSTKQKHALGRLFGQVFNKAAAGKPVAPAVIEAVIDGEWGEAKSYLVDEQRALLARMDVHAGFGESEAQRTRMLTRIFAGVCGAGRIDADVLRGFGETVGLGAALYLGRSLLGVKGERADVKIEDGNVPPHGKGAAIAAMANALARPLLRRIMKLMPS
jgi:hypothetical protein